VNTYISKQAGKGGELSSFVFRPTGRKAGVYDVSRKNIKIFSR
jgi:hypothetical protein